MRRRSPHDREIVRLALPALGALIAEPLYLLADTAIVGHLGTRPLGGIAIAAIVLTSVFGIFNFLAYTTTGTVARHVGADDHLAAAEHGIDGLWLATGLGLALTALGLLLVPFIADAMGASANVRPYAVDYLRISLLGAPFVLVALAAAGYLRGTQDTRTTLYVAVGANVFNLALEALLVYGFDTGIAGSAWGTVVAQVASALVFLAIIRHRARPTGARFGPRRAGVRAAAIVGSQLVVRTGSLLAALLATTAVAARISDTALAAHQVAFQIWTFLALTLDAIAIAGQALVGRYLGAGDGPGARAVARRMLELAIAAGLAIGVVVAVARPWLVVPFTDDHAVRSLTEQVLWFVAILQPLAAGVFVLDGILIGAGDARYLALAMLVASAIYAGLLAVLGIVGVGLVALWAAFSVWMVLRAVGLAARYRTGRWVVLGTLRAP
ncbi:MAG: MATE family efflux transporter [Acidimicrobiia bacterium]